MTKIKIVMDEHGKLFAKFSNGEIKEIFVNTYESRCYGVLSVDLPGALTASSAEKELSIMEYCKS